MIDPVQLPILLKAVDFVFEEGRKILQERRERRKMNDRPAEAEAEAETPKPALAIVPQDPEKIVKAKEELLTSRIDEILWKNHEAELKHLVRLLETYSNNYHLSKEQYAKWGSAMVPPIIVNNMVEAENAMIETIGKLEILLSKIYKKENPPPN
jgi:hypothetical protein